MSFSKDFLYSLNLSSLFLDQIWITMDQFSDQILLLDPILKLGPIYQVNYIKQ